MKIHKLFIAAILAANLLSSCSTSTSSVASGGVNPSESAILWQQTSAEYEALCYQAYEVAKYRLNNLRNEGYDTYDGKQFAVVLDLDETVLDNSPYNASLVLKGEEFSDASWEEWVKAEKAEMVPGALEFINFLRDNSIKYFFVSNRKSQMLKSTLNNLIKNGVELDDGNLLLDDGRSKKDRRESISDYQIALLIGDNLADFDEAFEDVVGIEDRKQLLERGYTSQFGNRFIILPNPLYGDWQESLKKESRKREDQLNLLRTF